MQFAFFTFKRLAGSHAPDYDGCNKYVRNKQKKVESVFCGRLCLPLPMGALVHGPSLSKRR
jgi:hypothetical protein